MDLDDDLNPEMLDSPNDSMVVGLGSFPNDSETVHQNIEERIRLLEVVTSRARQLQRSKQTPTAPRSVNISRTMDTSSTSNVPGMQITMQDTTLEMRPFGRRLNSFLIAKALEMDANSTSNGPGMQITRQDTTLEMGPYGRRLNFLLIAKALEMDIDGTTPISDMGSFYDCNICLNIARDPILTCCGHLFCWPCFYQLPYINSDVKECPECMQQVTDGSVVPIYGHGSGNDSHQRQFNQFGLKVPPRPCAHRIENIRRQHLDGAT